MTLYSLYSHLSESAAEHVIAGLTRNDVLCYCMIDYIIHSSSRINLYIATCFRLPLFSIWITHLCQPCSIIFYVLSTKTKKIKGGLFSNTGLNFNEAAVSNWSLNLASAAFFQCRHLPASISLFLRHQKIYHVSTCK